MEPLRFEIETSLELGAEERSNCEARACFVPSSNLRKQNSPTLLELTFGGFNTAAAPIFMPHTSESLT